MGSLVVQGEFVSDNVKHWQSFGEGKKIATKLKKTNKKKKKGEKSVMVL
jgi:hypothetical protein